MGALSGAASGAAVGSAFGPWGTAIGAGVGLLGGLFGSRRKGQAIKEAGTTLANAGHQAAADTWKIPGMVNPAIDTAYSRAGEDVFGNAWDSAANIEARANQARGDVASALAQGRTDLSGYLDPYARAGESALTSLAELAGARAPTLADLQMDPGYDFRLTQGQQALQRSAAARGVAQTGGFAKALTNYAQGAASQEYSNAFDRYMRGQEQRRSTLAGLAGLGASAASTAGTTLAQLGLRGGEAMGEFGLRGTTQAGNWTNEASQYKGNAGINSALNQANNIINSANLANKYNLGAAGPTAASQYGLGDTWGQFYSQAGKTVGDLIGTWGSGAGDGYMNPGRAPKVPLDWDYNYKQYPAYDPWSGGMPPRPR